MTKFINATNEPVSITGHIWYIIYELKKFDETGKVVISDSYYPINKIYTF